MAMKIKISIMCVYNSPKNSKYTKFYDSNVIDRLKTVKKSFQI